MSEHPRTQMNDDFTNPVRLSLMAALQGVDEIDFKTLRETLGVSDSVLSRHITGLEEKSYLKVRKGFVGKRPRTWVKLSAHGRSSLTEHIQALRVITSGL
ncbi:winged helix-turn-helix domain-containing protein [Glutamicibacter sp.]|jgi:Transcriptional regulators|uniref:winged helix-turn-helix domain-containing protein n=1 Tax=Glutamicibacter sp. TaxID=1931995 RepID=UPI002B482DE9|nr:transcriptional regulator [Glutamicibacter sp.]HJX77477.1 transcriptional regulator [Glutamicibacter sp.]